MIDGISSTAWNWYTQLQSSANRTQNSSSSSALQQLLDRFQSSGDLPRQPADPLQSLIDDGTLTEDQAAAVGQALQMAMQNGVQPNSDANPLAGLIADGTITQTQADSVKSTLEANRPGHGRGDLMNSVLNKLVAAGTLTQDQADQVKQEVAQNVQGQPPMPPPGGKGPQAEQAAAASADTSADSETISLNGLSEDEIALLVLEGKITSTQAEQALARLQNRSDSDAVQVSTGTQKQQRSPFEQLVSQGVLTSDQADTLRTALQQAMQSEHAMDAYQRSAASEVL